MSKQKYRPRQLLLIIICFVVIPCSGVALAVDTAGHPVWWEQALSSAQKEGYQLITPGELQSLRSDGKSLLLIDVRVGYEYCQGHLPDAINMPFDLGDQLALSPEKKDNLIKTLGPDLNRLVVIYCRNFR